MVHVAGGADAAHGRRASPLSRPLPLPLPLSRSLRWPDAECLSIACGAAAAARPYPHSLLHPPSRGVPECVLVHDVDAGPSPPEKSFWMYPNDDIGFATCCSYTQP